MYFNFWHPVHFFPRSATIYTPCVRGGELHRRRLVWFGSKHKPYESEKGWWAREFEDVSTSMIGYANGQNEMAVGILYNFPINIRGIDFSLDIVIADTRDKYDFPIILGRLFFSQTGLILDGEHGHTIRTPKEYQVFVVIYPEYEEDLSKTRKWIFPQRSYGWTC